MPSKARTEAAKRPSSAPRKRAATRATSGAKSSATKAGTKTDWRAETIGRMRSLIFEADPEMVEDVKWRKPSNNMIGVPVWSHHGIVCTGETYKDKVKLTFAKGASLDDPAGLFNSGLEGGTRRAIDIGENEKVNARAFKALVKSAVARNGPPAKKSKAVAPKKVKLLSGGNPQIPKGDGDAPVQAYIAAMPEWKRDVGRRLDAIIVRNVPRVRKAVKWNSPFYGVEGRGWFLSFHVFNRYVKVTFFRGQSLRPIPPGPSKDKDARYLDVYEGKLDEAQFADWVKQAAALPGWMA
jgi:hypothetical protein